MLTFWFEVWWPVLPCNELKFQARRSCIMLNSDLIFFKICFAKFGFIHFHLSGPSNKCRSLMDLSRVMSVWLCVYLFSVCLSLCVSIFFLSISLNIKSFETVNLHCWNIKGLMFLLIVLLLFSCCRKLFLSPIDVFTAVH